MGGARLFRIGRLAIATGGISCQKNGHQVGAAGCRALALALAVPAGLWSEAHLPPPQLVDGTGITLQQQLRLSLSLGLNLQLVVCLLRRLCLKLMVYTQDQI